MPPSVGLGGAGACDCGLRKRASPAALSAAWSPQPPAERRRQRHGRGAVWLLVPRGRGPRWGVRPGDPGRPGKCLRGVKAAGCPGAGRPGSAPCPQGPGAESCGSGRCGGAASVPVLVCFACVARALVCVRSRGSGYTCVDMVCVCFYVPTLRRMSVCLYACVCVCLLCAFLCT